MHQTVAQALALVERIKPKRAWFTHIAHDLGHAATNERLRKQGYSNVELVYDGLKLEIATDAPAAAAEPLRICGCAARWPGGVYVSGGVARILCAGGRGSVLAIATLTGFIWDIRRFCRKLRTAQRRVEQWQRR